MVIVVVEELRHNMEKQEMHRNAAEGCTHPLVYIVPHGPICIRIPLHGLLTLPRKVPVIPHGHI